MRAHGLGDVVGALQEVGHLVDAVDEGPRTGARELRRQGVNQLQGEAGEGGHRPGDVGQDPQFGFGAVAGLETGVGRGAAAGQRAAHGGPEIQAPSSRWRRLRARCTASLRASGWTAALQGGQLVFAQVHEVDVLGQRAPQRPGHCLGPPVGDQPPAHLGFDLLAHALEARPVLVGQDQPLQAPPPA